MALLHAFNTAQWANLRCASANFRPDLGGVAAQPLAVIDGLLPEAQPENTSDISLLERSWQVRQSGGQQQAESSHRRNVLIIDDDDDNLLFAQYAVEHLGYCATSIKSGQGAVAIAMTCCPDIILLDILLENINGIDVLRQLRQQESIAHVPVIAVTALSRPSDYKSIMAAGFSDYLLKPYMIDELEQMISRHLPA